MFYIYYLIFIIFYFISKYLYLELSGFVMFSVGSKKC